MRATPLLAPAAALTLVLLPLAAAHGGHEGFQQIRYVGDWLVSVEIPTTLLAAEQSYVVYVGVVDQDGLAPANAPTASLAFASPANATSAVALGRVAAGYASGNFTFPVKGTWRANVTLSDGQATEFTFPVYAASRWVIDSPNADSVTGDLYVAGEPATAAIRVRDGTTGAPAPSASDATARVEHWTDDHATKLDEATAPLVAKGQGVFELATTFPDPGMYHVLFASPTLGLAFEDRPYVHMYAVSPEDAEKYGLGAPPAPTKTPAPGAWGLLAGAAIVAIVIGRRARG